MIEFTSPTQALQYLIECDRRERRRADFFASLAWRLLVVIASTSVFLIWAAGW